jgi:hypothetical protein
MDQKEISASEHATLPVRHVIWELCSNGMDAGAVPQLVTRLLKSNGYNHAPLYICTWGPINGSDPIWCVQVHLYEKQLSYGVHEIHHIYHTTPRATLNAGIQDAARQALSVLHEEIR